MQLVELFTSSNDQTTVWRIVFVILPQNTECFNLTFIAYLDHYLRIVSNLLVYFYRNLQIKIRSADFNNLNELRCLRINTINIYQCIYIPLRPEYF